MLFTFWDHSITTAILLTTYKYIALGREKECVLSDFKFWILILLFLCLNWQFLQNESLIAIDARAIRLYFRKNKFKLCNHFLYSRSEFVCVSRKKASFFPLYFVLYTPPIPTSCLKFKIHRELDKVFGETKRKKGRDEVCTICPITRSTLLTTLLHYLVHCHVPDLMSRVVWRLHDIRDSTWSGIVY